MIKSRKPSWPFWGLILAAGMTLATLASGAERPDAASHQQFNFEEGDALHEVVVPAFAPWLWNDVSPGFNDVSLVFRYFHLVINAAYDAVAPYHPTAVGSYSRLGRRPAAETADHRNLNIAVLYAVYRSLITMVPAQADDWRDMMVGVGLDPDDDSLDPSTPAGIGNAAALAVMEGRRNDGYNQFGDAGGRQHNLMPFFDTTGYEPVNSAFQLADPGRWQPALVLRGTGNYRVQQFVTPQKANVEPYASFDPRTIRVPPPSDSEPGNAEAYKAQVDAVLKASASLTDEQKMMAEFFDNKVRDAISPPPIKVGASMMDFIILDFLLGVAGFDAGIVTWQEKRRYDAVRPFSAIRHVYGDQPVTAWGGPGKGTVKLPANAWQSYIPLADHPEYPSASACVCEAQAQAMRRFTGKDSTDGWVVHARRGTSRIEPGVTPTQNLSFRIDTWTDFSHLCGNSRVWGGTHFQPSVDEAIKACTPVGDFAYDYVAKLLDGSAPERGKSKPLPLDPRREDRSG